MTKKMIRILPCYFSFFVSGMLALVMGAVLPYIINEAGISYSVAGGLLSAFAIGNLLASFVAAPLINSIGRKWATVLLTSLIPIFLVVITFLPSTAVLYVAFLLPGIGRGTVSIVNNTVIAENDSRASAMNILHTMFAVGAFVAPFLTVLYVGTGFGWRGFIYTIAILASISVVLYAIYLEDKPKINKKSEAKDTIEKSAVSSDGKKGFLIIGMLLFFYLGVENCVNGWFVTYFKASGIMSDSYASNLVSVTWFLIMIGRLFTAYISSKADKSKLIFINCLCAAGCFFLMISTKNLALITLSVAGFGFFCAGIYPTSVATAGRYIRGSAAGMSILLAIAAVGGIIMPQIVGIIADHTGMAGGIGFLVVAVVSMLAFAIWNMFDNSRKKYTAEEI